MFDQYQIYAVLTSITMEGKLLFVFGLGWPRMCIFLQLSHSLFMYIKKEQIMTLSDLSLN